MRPGRCYDSLKRGALAQSEHLAAALSKETLGVKREPNLAGVFGQHQRDAEWPLAVELPVPRERRKRCDNVASHHAATRAAKDGLRIGSRMWTAKNLTTGTATPSPARW